MNRFFEQTLLRATGAHAIAHTTHIQTLWKGYGEIIRVDLEGSSRGDRVIAKHVFLPKKPQKITRKGSDPSHARKVKSYQIETNWYREWSSACDIHCKVPTCIALTQQDEETVIILEDLDATGFARRAWRPAWHEIIACLRWLAEFHATFLNTAPDGLWKTGTYWHLGTRQHELAALDDHTLKKVAGKIDEKLRSAIPTIVHGDAKVENFCFSSDGTSVAAVDFQYTGGGCGMKDVAYLVTSCLPDHECENSETELLDCYFGALHEALSRRGSAIDADMVEENWRPLYRIAWADFHRFYKGWSKNHFDPDCYSERITRDVAAQLST